MSFAAIDRDLARLRRRIDALKLRFARELAIVKLRRLAQAVTHDWTPNDPPDPARVIKRIVSAGFRRPTFGRLRRYLDDVQRQGEVPIPKVIVWKLLPWADDDRYDEFFRWDLPPREPRHDCPNLPAWV